MTKKDEQLTPITEGSHYVRRHPTIFFRNGEVSAIDVIRWLVAEALVLGASDVRVRRVGDWWTVSSPFDWLAGLDEEDYFRKIVALPALGQNTCRAEIVLSAFADAVATHGVGKRYLLISGESPSDELRLHMSNEGRAIAFRMVEPRLDPVIT